MTLSSANKNRPELIQNLHTEIGHFIARLILFNQRVADEMGVNTTDLQCLHIVQLLDGATPGQIAKHTNLTTGGVTVVLDRLEKTGYIKREPHPHDRRSIIVHVQEKKLKKLNAIYESRRAMLESVMSEQTDKELLAILKFFSKMREK